ncbi:4-aminobutyrate aminotransferase / (S)-3-amino-2-methylpropionate transaminase [Seinonella peptonophila]|uniref:4-aminobutyrate aminotransferase n=1 Tax=Seinonella peptonophila TaxID=112248 RepID=A0A1M4YDG7_9BACL|nr:4-aminobutyrate--2-oxoglutarate transaminase [Seinonella peptonophila]SHF03874.1 4-aminobutyrate aminotransferase / (S)-3-amino-2-methylpropionate transaminase [Seinonella peptonophila]
MDGKSFIQLKTSIPGTKGKELLERREKSVPRGISNTAPTFIEQGKGVIVTDVDGNQLIDFAGAIGTLNVGHCPPTVIEALKKQLDHYIHPGFPVIMYEPYVHLAEKLNQITPGTHEKKTFFLNSGAEAVENAVKVARKYTGRPGVISFERGFHGRTLLSMSLTSKVKPYKYEFGPFAPDTYKMRFPYYYRAPFQVSSDELDQEILRQLEEFFLSEVPAEQVAAMIMEPVQGEGGFIIPSKNFVQGVKQICEKHDILFIADEIQTGFGRTGKMFAMEHFEVVPDLITMSKSLGAGLPISAVTGRAEIMDAPNPGELGSTFGGSPLGCVAAVEVIKMMENELIARAQVIGERLQTRFQQMQQQFSFIGDVRGLGAMCAMEIVKDHDSKEPDKDLTATLVRECVEQGLIILSAGLFGNVIRILVPLVISDEQLEEGLSVMESVFADHV